MIAFLLDVVVEEVLSSGDLVPSASPCAVMSSALAVITNHANVHSATKATDVQVDGRRVPLLSLWKESFLRGHGEVCILDVSHDALCIYEVTWPSRFNQIAFSIPQNPGMQKRLNSVLV